MRMQAKALKVRSFVLAHIVPAVAHECQGHPVAHHLGFDVHAIGPAERHGEP